VKRTEIAVAGSPAAETLRLELNGHGGDDGLVLELLHDDRQTGTLARVLGGRIGLGEVTVPVAVKLQRDMALSQEDRGSVAAKFDKERNVHRRLQEQPEQGNGQERIVRQLEVWHGPAAHEADSLEPCILCAWARHGLAPRCPECNDPAAVLEELELTDDRGLRCARCQRQFWSTPKTRDSILTATLRHDPACHGCAYEHRADSEACRTSAVFLNFFRNRVLLLERLDLDLDDYLRWTRDAGLSATRQAARQAFDRHVSLLAERRAQLPSPSVAKVSDLMRVADLFSDILTGVEHLHRHDVAHLDLKPANVCLHFRGADLDVKIIDLGLSDDPNTLAYLRQAEGPLSLWTDYSAPEFRRPRARPIAVDGRFREDGCDLEWPGPEGAAAELPCPGDLLFFEARDVKPERVRVLHVVAGPDGRWRVQAEAEPQHAPWRGEARTLPAFATGARVHTGVAVVLEKHCGFPADVHSLGMMLLAVLVGQPDVGDFREALPGVQIELEEHLRDGPMLPGRALVQHLLGEPSKHLQVFHAYARRLAVYGVAQPLAEELLGIVLRATLRGDPRVFYLANRGADARTAMRRLRADLDAVRGALRAALAVAQSAAVRDTRLTVLDRLRARLYGRPAGTPTPPRPDAAARLLYPALDLGAADEEHGERELTYLSPLAGQPGSVLSDWERELNGVNRDGLAPGRSRDFLARYCRRLDGSAADFLQAYHRLIETVVRAAPARDSVHADDRERVVRWVDDHQALANRLEFGPRFVQQFREFLVTLAEKWLTPWDRALQVRQFFLVARRSAAVTLSRAERAAIGDGPMVQSLDRLVGVVQEAVAVRQERDGAFEHALLQWRASCAGRSWVDSLARLEGDALRQRHELEAACALWDQNWLDVQARLRQFLTDLGTTLRRYDPHLTPGPAAQELTFRLPRAERHALDVERAQEDLGWLRANWPAPSERAESLFAHWELELTHP
jgi:serine/threonine protein kinase